jgi:serine/threonine-protein kinase RsbW
MTAAGLASVLLSHVLKGWREMREQDESTSSTGSLHSAGPLFQIEQSIRSEIDAISPFVDKLMVFIKKCQCVAGNEIDVEISLREALANGVVHGNHEDPGKQVYVNCCCVPNEEVSIVVKDEGTGFSSTDLPDPAAAGQLQSTHGRGIYLMKSLMDEVHFERGGSVVRMRKKCTKPDRLGPRMF